MKNILLKCNKQNIFIFIAFLSYLAFLIVLPNNTFWIFDNGNRYIILKQIINHSHNPLEFPYTGEKFDADKDFFPIPQPFAIQKKNYFLNQYNSFFARLNAPLYKILGFKGLLLLPFICGFLISLKFYLLIGTNKNRFTSWTVIFFGTPIIFYCFLFWEHTLSILLFSSALLLCLNKKKLSFTSIICFCLAFFFREESIIAILSVLLILLHANLVKITKVNWILSILICCFILIIHKNENSFTHYTANIGQNFSLMTYFKSRLSVFNNLFLGNNLNSLYNSYFSIAWLLMFMLTFFRRNNLSFSLLIYNILSILYAVNCLTTNKIGFFLLKSNGLFFSFPLFTISLLLLIHCKRHHYHWIKIFYFIYGLVTVLLCPHFSSYGIHWSARIMLFIIPVILIHFVYYIFPLIKKLNGKQTFLKYQLLLSLILSVILQINSLYYIFLKKSMSHKLPEINTSSSQKAFIITSPIISMDLFPFLYQQNIFLCKDLTKLGKLKSSLKNNKINNINIIHSNYSTNLRFPMFNYEIIKDK